MAEESYFEQLMNESMEKPKRPLLLKKKYPYKLYFGNGFFKQFKTNREFKDYVAKHNIKYIYEEF